MDAVTARLTREMMTFEMGFSRAVHDALADADVTHARLRLLGALACDGPRIMAELAASLQITPRAVTKLVDALEAEGLVRRSSHPTDRRATVVESTPEGHRLGERLTGEQLKAVGEVFSPLTPEQRSALLDLVTHLNETLAPRGSEPG